MDEKYSQTCEACLPFRTIEDFKNYIERRNLEEQLTRLIRENGAIAVIGFGGTGKTTLVNKVLFRLEEYERIDVLVEGTEFSLFRSPQEIISNFLCIIIDTIGRKSGVRVHLAEAVELAKSLEIPSHSIYSVPSKDILEAVKENEKLDLYVSKIQELLQNQSKTFIVVLDDLVDLIDRSVRKFLITLIRVLHQSLGSNKIKFLVVARETKTLGRELLLGKDEILELEDNFSCIRIGGFEKSQVEKFLKDIMHFTYENKGVIDVLYRKTQGRPRVLCYALTSFRRKYRLSYVSLQDAKDETKFPSTPKHQLNNYLSEVYGKHRIELVAASVLRNFTQDELSHLCSKIGKKITEDDFNSFRNSGLLEEINEKVFVTKDIYKPLLVDIYESLLSDNERFRYNRLMVHFQRKKVSFRSDLAVVFHVQQILDYAPSNEKEELLKALMNSAHRLSIDALKDEFFIIAIHYGAVAHAAAVELKAHERALSIIQAILRSALNAKIGRRLMEDYFSKANEEYNAIIKKDDNLRNNFVWIICSYALYYCDSLRLYSDALQILEKARTLIDEIENMEDKLECLGEFFDAQTRIHLELEDAVAARKSINLFKNTIEEQKNRNEIPDDMYNYNMALVEDHEADVWKMDGDLMEALAHCKKSIEYFKKGPGRAVVQELKLATLQLLANEIHEATEILEGVLEEARSVSPKHYMVFNITLTFAHLIQGELEKATVMVKELDTYLETLPHLKSYPAVVLVRASLLANLLLHCKKSSEAKELTKLLVSLTESLKTIHPSPELSTLIVFFDYITGKKNKNDTLNYIESLQTQNKAKLKILKQLKSSISKDDLQKTIRDIMRILPQTYS